MGALRAVISGMIYPFKTMRVTNMLVNVAKKKAYVSLDIL